MMRRQIVVITGPDKGRVFELTPGETFVIGRGHASQTLLNDLHVSRVHCSVQVESDKVLLIDAGSVSGTMVDGRQIAQHDLEPGEIIQIGETQLRFVLEGVPQGAIEAVSVSQELAPQIVPLKELVGASISRFQLDAIIGAGVTGTVYRAHDVTDYDLVAIKVLSPQFTGSNDQQDRFVRAITTMLPIRHENLVELYAAGKHGPYCWIAMEYVDGENLSQVIKRIGAAGMLDWRNAFHVAMCVARALEKAYEHKIIHRNVTPTNIFCLLSGKVVKLGVFTFVS